MRGPVICLDGPAGSGKTTVARALADRLGFLYLDTGVLYRALTWAALQRGVPPGDAEGLAKLAAETAIEVRPAPPGDPRQTLVCADGRDVSLEIRSPEVDAHVSEVSAHPAVRAALLGVQRAVAERGGVILAGRDAGTVVWPEAEVKVFLDAGEEERARRRQKQSEEQGVDVEFSTVLAELCRRDRYDSGRQVAPLRPATDAVVVDTTHMPVEQVVEEVLLMLRRKTGVQPARPGQA